MQQTQTALFSAADLPFSMMTLSYLGQVNITGQDAKSYLQGQATADVMTLADDHFTFAGHCDAKGKLWGYFMLFTTDNGLVYLEQRSVLTTQLAELKKYAVFSKVSIEADDQSVIMGFAGNNAREHLAHYFSTLPSATCSKVTNEKGTLLYLPFPTERFIAIIDAETAQDLTEKLAHANHASDAQWQALDIEAGYAILAPETSAQFLPQAFNLQAIDAINFRKGCYVGQEMVARAKYRGANKRALFWLKGEASHLPKTGEGLEMQLGENWRETGTVLGAVKLADNIISVQIIMNNDIDVDAVFRVKNDIHSRLSLCALPYSLAEN